MKRISKSDLKKGLRVKIFFKPDSQDDNYWLIGTFNEFYENELFSLIEIINTSDNLSHDLSGWYAQDIFRVYKLTDEEYFVEAL